MLWVYNILFNKLGVIYVVDELDYEQKKQYELTVRATDSVSGVYAEVLVSILVLDVNDCPPEFTQDSYNISVSEAASFGTSILKVGSRDNDTGWFKLFLLFSIFFQFPTFHNNRQNFVFLNDSCYKMRKSMTRYFDVNTTFVMS